MHTATYLQTFQRHLTTDKIIIIVSRANFNACVGYVLPPKKELKEFVSQIKWCTWAQSLKFAAWRWKLIAWLP